MLLLNSEIETTEEGFIGLGSFMVPSELELRDCVTLRPVDAFHVLGVVPARASAGVQEIRWRSSLERCS